jgi:hypothetical protein
MITNPLIPAYYSPVNNLLVRMHQADVQARRELRETYKIERRTDGSSSDTHGRD